MNRAVWESTKTWFDFRICQLPRLLSERLPCLFVLLEGELEDATTKMITISDFCLDFFFPKFLQEISGLPTSLRKESSQRAGESSSSYVPELLKQMVFEQSEAYFQHVVNLLDLNPLSQAPYTYTVVLSSDLWCIIWHSCAQIYGVLVFQTKREQLVFSGQTRFTTIITLCVVKYIESNVRIPNENWEYWYRGSLAVFF